VIVRVPFSPWNFFFHALGAADGRGLRFMYLKVPAYGTAVCRRTRCRPSCIRLFSGDGYCLLYCAAASTSQGQIASGSMTGNATTHLDLLCVALSLRLTLFPHPTLSLYDTKHHLWERYWWL
jgi:hypothetical protein